MKPGSFFTTRNVLLVSLVAEGATALAAIVAPTFIAQLLFGTDVSGAGIAFGRLLGITLLALVIACWPGTDAPGGARAAVLAFLAYNLLAALYLAYLGVARRPMGILLWPAVVEHALVALLLVNGWRNARRAVALRP